MSGGMPVSRASAISIGHSVSGWVVRNSHWVDSPAGARASSAMPRGTGMQTSVGSFEETPPSGGGGNGTLRVNSRPWSQVFVDGRLIGNTPQMNIQLSPGSHQVTFVNPEFNIRETRSVNIQPGETELLNPTLNPG